MAVSFVSPARVRPRAARACIGPFASCRAFAFVTSASHSASACSSSGARVVRSTYAARPLSSAIARPLASPAPFAHVPSTNSPARPVIPASHVSTSPSPSTTPSTLTSPSASGCAVPSVANRRSRSTLNSRPSKTRCTSSRFQSWRARSSGVTGSGTSTSSWLRRRLRSTPSRWARTFSPALPLIWSTLATRPSRSPYCPIHFAAVLGPTPGTPGRLSLFSPTSAARSL